MSKKPSITLSLGMVLLAAAAAGMIPIAAFAATINGTSGNDTLQGTDSADTIYGKAGNDKIYGYKGNDILYGGTGDDQIWGGSHDDKIYAWYGNNIVSGGEGNDQIWATGQVGSGIADQNNMLRGYGGNDKFIIRASGATVYGGSGNDNVDAAADSGTGNGFKFYGEDGDDTMKAVDTSAEMHGGNGKDRLIGHGEAFHRMYGEAHDDYLEIDVDSGSEARGGTGNDYLLSVFEGRLYGEDGNDILESRTELANNLMYGGPGADEFRCNGENDYVQDFNAAEGDTITGSCESLNVEEP